MDDTIQIFVKKPENVEQCDDSPTFANCDLIVKAGYCSKNPFYSKFCCASCTEAGQPLYEPKAEDEQENVPQSILNRPEHLKGIVNIESITDYFNNYSKISG